MSVYERFPYHISVNRDDWDVMQEWCKHYIGEFDRDWYKLGLDPAAYVIHGDRSTTWMFKNERDVILFKLKWT